MATCDVDSQLKDALKAFRFRKKKDQLAALIVKIDAKNLIVLKEHLLEETSYEAISECLPDNQPRYLLLSYEYQYPDGRKTNPLVGIYYSPEATNDQLRMLYASTKNILFGAADMNGKILDLRDCDQLSEKWLNVQLGFK